MILIRWVVALLKYILAISVLISVLWFSFITIAGDFGNADVVLQKFSHNSLDVSKNNNGLSYTNDAWVQAWVKDPQKKETVTIDVQKNRLDSMYISKESADKTVCEMIKFEEEGNAILVNNLAFKMPFVFLVKSRGGSSALQSAVGNIMGYHKFWKKPLEIWYTAAVSKKITDDEQCALILSNIRGRIDSCRVKSVEGSCPNSQLAVRYNIQGAEQLSHAVFKKPVSALDLCEKSVLAASYNQDLSRFNWLPTRNSKGEVTNRGINNRALAMVQAAHPDEKIPADMCVQSLDKIQDVVFRRLAKPQNHWLRVAQKQIELNIPSNIDFEKFIKFNTQIQTEWSHLLKTKSWSPITELEVSVFKNGHRFLQYGSTESLQKGGADSQQSLSSIAKLIALKVEAESNGKLGDVTPIPIPNIKNRVETDGKLVSLDQVYCHSNNEGAYALAKRVDTTLLREELKKYSFNTHVSDINVAVSTERVNASTPNLQWFLYDLAKMSASNTKLRFIATRAALGKNCTLYDANPLVENRQLLLSKTGTYYAEGTIYHKLAVWAWQQPKSKDIFTVVVRVMQSSANGICYGTGCISHSHLLGIYKKIMTST